ncbi:MAG: MFS transporter, partial [Spirochaetaceae bacterium]|nr:MFS transporter [Spirochaetaceae bacterium]
RALVACQTSGAVLTIAMSFLFRVAWAPWLIVGSSFFRGAARPLIGAILTDLSPPERRKEVFGLQYWSINVGVAVGPLVAAFLFDTNMPWLFRGDAAATLASVALIVRGVRMPTGGGVAATVLERHDERGAVRAFLSRPILLAFCAIALVSTVTYSQTGFSLPLRISSALGAEGISFFGIMMSLNAMTVIVFSIPVARALRGLTPMLCMALSGAFYVLGFGLLAAPVGKIGFAVSTFVWTIGEIVAATNTGVFIAKHSPANWRASFQSFIGVFFQAGWSLGPLAAGPLIEAAGHSALWASASVLCVVWGLAALAIDRADRRIGAAASVSGE